MRTTFLLFAAIAIATATACSPDERPGTRPGGRFDSGAPTGALELELAWACASASCDAMAAMPEFSRAYVSMGEIAFVQDFDGDGQVAEYGATVLLAAGPPP